MFNNSGAAVFNNLATSRLFGNTYRSYQHYQPGKITLQVSVLMTELVLVATSYELWMMLNLLLFVALIMTVAADIVNEKSGICVW